MPKTTLAAEVERLLQGCLDFLPHGQMRPTLITLRADIRAMLQRLKPLTGTGLPDPATVTERGFIMKTGRGHTLPATFGETQEEAWDNFMPAGLLFSEERVEQRAHFEAKGFRAIPVAITYEKES